MSSQPTEPALFADAFANGLAGMRERVAALGGALRLVKRPALRLLGHALLGLGELPAALAVYQQVMDLDETLEAQHLRVETATDLARVALAQGDTDQAVTLVTAIVPDLETGRHLPTLSGARGCASCGESWGEIASDLLSLA